MIRRTFMVVAAVGACIGLSLGAIALAQAGRPAQKSSAPKASSESSTESTAPEQSATDPDNVQYTAPSDTDHRGAEAARRGRSHRSATRSRSGSHRAHRSQRSRARPDPRRAGAAQPGGEPNEAQGEQESSVESEQGQPGEPVKGHEDPAGQNVNHECTGNCVE
jgi:hypothetical protein